ncbi:restriction endonuclease [Vibrio harveyi]|nr:restriction endonuclease [Vibrio harveyi]
MSNLSYLEKLLDGVNVEWKSFGEIAKIQRGASPRPIAKFITDDEDGVPWIKIGDTESGSKYVEQTAQKITKEGATKSRVLKKGDFIISNSMSFGRPYILNITGAIHDGWASISEFSDKLNSDFLYHYLSSQSVQNYWISKINSGSVSNLNADIIKTLPVPIPCPDNPEKSLAIQAEIVRILDAFTELTAELTAELNLRKKQYNYYRDKLLTSELPSSKTATLGEVLDMRAGRHIKAKDISAIKNTEHKYICFGGNGSRGFVQAYSHDGDYALIGRQGALCGNVKRATGKFYATEHAVVCTPKEEIDIDWIFHMLTFMNLNQYKSQSAQPGLAVGNLANLAINFPPISEQKKIAKILNKFDTLTTSLQEGLPREIELRQKQYEYYRDLLLSFPKSNEGAA